MLTLRDSFIWCFTLLGMYLLFLFICPNLPAFPGDTVPWRSFWTLNHQHTYTSPTQNLTVHITCNLFFLPLIRLLSFFSLSREKTTFFFLSFLFSLYIVDNTDVTVIYIHYHYPCYSYFTLKWWEMYRLLDRYITRKQETWQILEA